MSFKVHGPARLAPEGWEASWSQPGALMHRGAVVGSEGSCNQPAGLLYDSRQYGGASSRIREQETLGAANHLHRTPDFVMRRRGGTALDDGSTMRFLSRAALMAGFLLVLAALWPYINLLFFPGTRLYVGTHRQFFLDCARLRPGVPSSDVLAAMRGYVLASTGEVIDAPAISVVKPTPGSSAGRIGADSSLLILPTKHDQADWCICYFRRGRLVKTVVSPD